jgi:hypothetical protein
MKAKRFTEEQIIGVLREAEAGVSMSRPILAPRLSGNGALYRRRLFFSP